MFTAVFLKTSEVLHICSNQHVYLNSIKPPPNSPSDTLSSLYSHLKTRQKQLVCDFGYPSCLNVSSYSSSIPTPSHPIFSLHNDTKTPRTNRKPNQGAPSVTVLHPLCRARATLRVPLPSPPHRGEIGRAHV